jgi:hypothetical protein
MCVCLCVCVCARERERDYSGIFIYVRHLCSHTSKPKKGYKSGVPAKDVVVIKGFSWFRFRFRV